MASSFLKLTDTDQVRSALGVDDTDIKDSLICSLKPQDDLESDLLTWLPTYQTIISEGLASSPSAEQHLKFLKLKLYSKYFIAATLASGGANSILQKQSDGANEAVRFTNMKLSEMKQDLLDKAASLKDEIELLVDPDSAISYSQFGAVQPTYDPVTNE